MKLEAGYAQKNYGNGPWVSIAREVPEALYDRKEELQGVIAAIIKECREAVEDEVAKSKAAVDPDLDRRPAPANQQQAPATGGDRRPRSTEYDDRRDDHPPDRYEERYEDRRDDGRDQNDRNGPPPRRDDRERYRDDGGGRRTNNDREPRTGRQLFGWAKDRDELKWFSAFGKDKGFPKQFNDWDDRDVDDAMRAFNSRRSESSRNGNGRH